jgi:hypothetical protein
MRQIFFDVHRAYHAILLKHGMDQVTPDDWSNLVDEGKRSTIPVFRTPLCAWKFAFTDVIHDL